MGAGIGFIPNAFFCVHIDVSYSYEDAKEDLRTRDRGDYLEILASFKTFASKRRYVELHPFEHSDEEIWEWAGELQSEYADQVLEHISDLKIHGLGSQYYGRFSHKNTRKSEWTAEFRGQGILLSENDLVQVVAIYSTDNDVAVGAVLKPTLRDVEDDLLYDFEDKWNWYQARGLDWSAALEKKSKKELDRLEKKARKMADQILVEIRSHYPVRFRTSAWTMSPKTSPVQVTA